MKVTLTVHGRERDGEQFVFTEPGSLVFGRSSKAQCQIANDPYVSRYQFLLLINPPAVRLLNLSHSNGTTVDGVLHTQEGELDPASEAETLVKPLTPQKGASAILRNDSEIEVGYTKIRVAVESTAYCVECGQPVPDDAAPADNDVPLCTECEAKRPEPETLVKTRAETRGKQPVSQPVPAPVGGKSGSVSRMIRNLLRDVDQPKAGVPKIPGYQIEKKLQSGGMGMVLEARRVEDSRRVAVKIVRPDRAASRELTSRFKREIKISDEFAHPNIVSVLDFGAANGVMWFAMEFVEGAWDMEKHLKKTGGKLPWRDCVDLMLPALDGLAHAHSLGIIHRDLKPSNILLDGSAGTWIPKLTDFGIAKSLENAGLNESILTKRGVAMGTIPFMPPEQARDVRTCTQTADVFSMGATLYLMLTGRLIRDFSQNFNEAIRQVLSGPPVAILSRGVAIPKSLAAVVDKTLSMEPKGRYPHAGAFRDALRAACS